jgi:hypothetical protein
LWSHSLTVDRSLVAVDCRMVADDKWEFADCNPWTMVVVAQTAQHCCLVQVVARSNPADMTVDLDYLLQEKNQKQTKTTYSCSDWS